VLRVVLDTNVLVSGLVYPASIPGKIMDHWRQGRLHLVLSRYILDEMVRVLPRMKRNTLGLEEINSLAENLLFLAEIAEVRTDKDLGLRDDADQQVLGTLRSSAADYLVTGDKDLLALAAAYSIVTPATL
jgi:putative PIN family toxin of toxin-antitoxin system